ncbi:MAG TPA: hypothetical protein VG937_38240 [Polyangiaceae bacterium]|nr:hypothetical protein [Polyangiaceae bacterium]
MRSWLPFVVALIAGVTACGQTTNTPHGSGAQSEQSEGGSGGASGGSGGKTGGGAGSEATYAGAVLSMVTEREATRSYVARAIFTAGTRPSIGGCPQCCCRSTDRGLPIPIKPPDAGDIAILATDGTSALATLVPERFEDGRGVFHGMIDLGWSWFAPLSDYALVPSEPWNGRDTLRVLAEGNEVEAFSGSLRAGTALGGVTPPIGSAPVIADHTQPFTVSWTPGGDADATVLLGIPNASGLCYCDAPDSAGTLSVPASLLSPISGEISLARLTVATVAGSNANIDLVGAAVLRGTVEVR